MFKWKYNIYLFKILHYRLFFSEEHCRISDYLNIFSAHFYPGQVIAMYCLRRISSKNNKQNLKFQKYYGQN